MMKITLGRKSVWIAGLFLWVMIVRVLGGCSLVGVEQEDADKVRDLTFTVVGDVDVPEELQKLIEEKKGEAFKLTYSNDQGLYIVSGYGKQESGGYSIAVEALYLTENSIVFDTELLGPEKGEEVSAEPSYPYIVILTESLEEPVIFR